MTKIRQKIGLYVVRCGLRIFYGNRRKYENVTLKVDHGDNND